MLPNNLYQDFFSSSFFIKCKEQGMVTNDFFTFMNSFVGIRNFIRNHPKPIIEYYWISDRTQAIQQLADKIGIHLKKVVFIDENASSVIVKEDEYPVYLSPEPVFYDPGNYGGIEAVKWKISKAAYLVDLKSNDIVENETLWEKCELLQNECYSIRHSSDEFEYHSIFKTGWAYLLENQHIKLDLLLISFLKDKNISLKKEQIDEYAGFRFGVHPVPLDIVNGLMAFRTHPIDEDLIPIIMNDPIQWEGIFYDKDFCNISILHYIKKIEPRLEEIFFH